MQEWLVLKCQSNVKVTTVTNTSVIKCANYELTSLHRSLWHRLSMSTTWMSEGQWHKFYCWMSQYDIDKKKLLLNVTIGLWQKLLMNVTIGHWQKKILLNVKLLQWQIISCQLTLYFATCILAYFSVLLFCMTGSKQSSVVYFRYIRRSRGTVVECPTTGSEVMGWNPNRGGILS